MITFLHISDTHISGDPGYSPPWLEAGSAHPNHGAAALLREITQLPYPVDFVLHTGDVCADPHEADYARAREMLSAIDTTLLLLPGNHDSGDLLAAHLHDGESRHVLRDDHFQIGDLHILALDTSGGEHAPLLRAEQLRWLDSALENCAGGQILVAAHHPLLETGIPYLDESMRVQNGAAAHEILARHAGRIVGVLYGHIHQPTISCADGISYISCPSTWNNLTAYPGSTDNELDRHCPPGYNLMTLQDGRLFARRCALPPTRLNPLREP